MKEQINILKLTCLGAFVGLISVGCASSGHARLDTGDDAMGVSGEAEVGTDADADLDVDIDRQDLGMRNNEGEDASDSVTATAMSFAPVTDVRWMSRFGPDWSARLRSIDTYTFRVPVDAGDGARASFRTDLPPGSTYVEAAAGESQGRGYKIIRHSPNPR